MRHKSSRLALSLAALSLLSQDIAYANGRMLEEVTVTARKRSESLQDVPMSVAAFSADQLATSAAMDITDIEKLTPNITLAETGGLVAGSLSAFIRGIGNDPGFDSGVGIYVDDVYLNTASGALLELYDVERIEVLKGPQGHLYGRNTIGGAIKYISRAPSEVPEASLELGTGRFDRQRARLSLSGPLGNQLRGVISVLHDRHDGIQRNSYTGEEYWAKDVQAIRASLDWAPSDQHSFRLSVDHVNDESSPRLPGRVALNSNTLSSIDFVISAGNKFLGGTGLVDSPSDQRIPANPDQVGTEIDDAFDRYRLETTTAALTWDWSINDTWSVKSITAGRRVENDVAFDYDGTDQEFITTVRERKSTDLSQELQLNFEAGDLKGLIGYYYLDGHEENSPYTEQFPRLRAVQYIRSETLRDDRDVTSHSLFVSLDWDINDRWALSLGGRYTQDSKELDQLNENFSRMYALAAIKGFPPAAIAAIRPGTESLAEQQPLFAGWVTPFDRALERTVQDAREISEDWNEFTPSARLSYRLGDDTLLYAGVSSGFKSGGFQLTGGKSRIYDPETVTAWTLGAKTSLLDGLVTLNSELFYNDYQDKQLSTIILDDGVLDQTVSNVGGLVTQGAELEVSALLPFDLRGHFNIGYLDVAVRSYETRSADGDILDISDRTAVGFSPRWTAQLGLGKDIILGEYGSLDTGITLAYRSRSWVNSPVDLGDSLETTQIQREHLTANARVAWRSSAEHWEVELVGRNLTDERVLTNSYVVGPFVNGGYSEPRTWFLGLTYRY